MKCSRKSTTWLASAVAALLTATAGLGAQRAPIVCDTATIAPVVGEMVRSRMAAPASSALTVRVLACELGSAVPIDAALPEPGARLGRPARFRLMGAGRQVGYAVAVASGAVAQVRATRAVAAGAVLEPGVLAATTADADGVLIEPLPGLDEIVGTRALRAIAEGELISTRIVRIAPAVRSGERVVIRTRAGRVEIRGVGTAQQSGAIGDVIRLVNVDSRRTLRGRITRKGEVEVGNAF